MAHYSQHYESQLGGAGIETVYRGATHQRGHGIGSFLGGLFRRVLPLLTSGARAVGREALRAGMNVLGDMENNVPFKESFKSHARESVGELKRKAKDKIANLMKGSRYKTPSSGSGRQLTLARLNRLISARTSRKTDRVSKRKTVKSSENAKKKKKNNNKKKKTTATKRKRSPKKRSVTDIFGPA